MSSNPVPAAAATAAPPAMRDVSPPTATPPTATLMAIASTAPASTPSALGSSPSRNYNWTGHLYAQSAAAASFAAPPAFPTTPSSFPHNLQQLPRTFAAALPIPIPGPTQSAPPPLPPPRFIHELSAGRDMGWTFGNRSLTNTPNNGGDSYMSGALNNGSTPYYGHVSQIVPGEMQPRVQRGIKVASRHVLKRDAGDQGRPRKRRSLGTPLGAEMPAVADGGAAERNSWRLSLPGRIEKEQLPLINAFDRKQLSRLDGIASERSLDPAVGPADMPQHGGCSLPPLRTFAPSLPLRHDPASAPASTTTLSTRRGVNRAPDALNTLAIPGPAAMMHGSPESSWQFSPAALPSAAISLHRSPIRDGHSSDSSQISPQNSTDLHGLIGTSLALSRSMDQEVFGLEIDEKQTAQDEQVAPDDIGGQRKVKRRKPSSLRDAGEDRAGASLSLEMRRRPSEHTLPSLAAQISLNPAPSSFTPSLVSSSSLSAASSLGTEASSDRRLTNLMSPATMLSPPTIVSPEAKDSAALSLLGPTSPTDDRNTEPERLRKMNPFSLHRFGELQPERGPFMCDCCQKNPKYFDNLNALFAHEAVKQYKCSFCNNRFKNKNEAERHQNSLHLRRYSWSCASLGTVADAFHARPAAYPGAPASTGGGDTCCYCGKMFAYPPDWTRRTDHLLLDHKFGECNQSKRFFRADHFRQHLKHSHMAVVGKWTNYLEGACMTQRVAVGTIPTDLAQNEGQREGGDEGPVGEPSEDGDVDDE